MGCSCRLTFWRQVQEVDGRKRKEPGNFSEPQNWSSQQRTHTHTPRSHPAILGEVVTKRQRWAFFGTRRCHFRSVSKGGPQMKKVEPASSHRHGYRCTWALWGISFADSKPALISHRTNPTPPTAAMTCVGGAAHSCRKAGKNLLFVRQKIIPLNVMDFPLGFPLPQPSKDNPLLSAFFEHVFPQRPVPGVGWDGFWEAMRSNSAKLCRCWVGVLSQGVIHPYHCP